MFPIKVMRQMNEITFRMDIEAPMIARKLKSGQFVIIRLHEKSEKIPLTVADWDAAAGVITIIFQAVGKSTLELSQQQEGGAILNVTGPLGIPSELEHYKRAAVIGGGLGCAIAYPQAKHLAENGADVDVIIGFRNKSLVILEEEISRFGRAKIMTDDGSYGDKGFVTDGLKALIDGGADYDLVVAIGPPIMMKAVAELTRPYGIKTIVSLCPVMIDGTGMCGCCRVTVGGETRFVCVEGPDFDAHEVDFDELMSRLTQYRDLEKEALEAHKCRIGAASRAIKN